MTYYVILSKGVPVDVTNIWHQAETKLREWSTRAGPAQLVECVPLQTEFDFDAEMDEAPTAVTDWNDLNG